MANAVVVVLGALDNFLTSMVFLLVAPVTLAGLRPSSDTGWRLQK